MKFKNPKNKLLACKKTPEFRVRLVRYSELDNYIIASWANLEGRSLEDNAYLSPYFVIPAIRHLSNDSTRERTIFIFVEKVNRSGKEVVGVGIFSPTFGTKKFPVPHLKNYRSVHSYLGGLLLDYDEAFGAVSSMFHCLSNQNALWHGVDLFLTPSDGAQIGVINDVVAEMGARLFVYQRNQRAVFKPPEGGENYLKKNFSSRRIKELRRARKRLEEQGKVRWNATFGSQFNNGETDKFLTLEHMGWKLENRTSLLSKISHEKFFREMVDGFKKQDRFFFTELRLNEAVIASTSNLIAGRTGFAFKIGWDPGFAKVAPGILNEVEFILNVPEVCRGLSQIDSGASEGSFIDKIWKDRRILLSIAIGTTAIGKSILAGMDRIRRLKDGSKPTSESIGLSSGCLLT